MYRRFARKRSPEERARSVEDLDGSKARSRWERNVLRWLKLLRQRGEIHDFKYEPREFWFEGVKRGNRFWKPDMAVWDEPGEDPSYYIEVKGLMDRDSLIKLERMAKFHPDVRVVLIGKERYGEIEREFGPMIEKWEWK